MELGRTYTELFIREGGLTLSLSKQAFDSLRRGLSRHHKLMVEIGGSTLSVRSKFDPVTQTGKFWLGENRFHNYQILDPISIEERSP